MRESVLKSDTLIPKILFKPDNQFQVSLKQSYVVANQPTSKSPMGKKTKAKGAVGQKGTISNLKINGIEKKVWFCDGS